MRAGVDVHELEFKLQTRPGGPLSKTIARFSPSPWACGSPSKAAATRGGGTILAKFGRLMPSVTLRSQRKCSNMCACSTISSRHVRRVHRLEVHARLGDLDVAIGHEVLDGLDDLLERWSGGAYGSNMVVILTSLAL